MQIECGVVLLNTASNKKIITEIFELPITEDLALLAHTRNTHLLVYLSTNNLFRIDRVSNTKDYLELFNKYFNKVVAVTAFEYYQELLYLGINPQDAFRQFFASCNSFD